MTAEEFCKQFRKNNPIANAESIEHWMGEHCIEFAKFHVKAALNTIYEKGLSDITTWDGNPEGSEYLDFDKLIAAYPLDKIK